MSSHPAGTRQKKLFSQDDYLAPLPLPTGQQPVDSLNIIWRKNEVYLDIGCYSVGSAVMVIWPMIIFYLTLAYSFRNLIPQLSIFMLIAGAVITGIPTLILIHGLFRPTPPPVRFNRQRREVYALQRGCYSSDLKTLTPMHQKTTGTSAWASIAAGAKLPWHFGSVC
ncbi:hypothetical protein A256_07740, partial [Pseudomonas syringae pv. actinidiae ICMP 19103]